MGNSNTQLTSLAEVRNRVNSGFSSFRQSLIIILCFLLHVADGFDVLAISMAAPHIAADWQIEPQLLGVVLSAELVGMIIGSVVMAGFADSYGRRRVLIVSVALISVSMILTSYSSSVIHLLIFRVVTGFGIGGVIGSSAALAAEYSPQVRRNQVIIFVNSGFMVGSLMVGPIANYLITNTSWQAIFMTGGVAGLVLLVLLVLVVPESLEYLATQKVETDDQKNDLKNKINHILKTLSMAPIDNFVAYTTQNGNNEVTGLRGLLSDNFRILTVKLWALFFFCFWIIYMIVKWTPKLYVDMGFDITSAIYALTVGTLGGLFGNLCIGVLASRMKIEKLVATMMACGTLSLLAYGLMKPDHIAMLYTMMFIMYFFISGGYAGSYAIAANAYPTHLRASSLGYCIGIGRLGAVISPIVTGFLVGAGWNMFTLYLILAVPLSIAAVILVLLIKTDESAF